MTSTYEGRDKLTKMMQYSSKLMSWYYREGDYLQSLKYLDVYDRFREARSVFRLSKFLFEIKRIKIIYQVNEDKFSQIMNIASRFFYMFHWLFDNVSVTLKLINSSVLGYDKDHFRLLSRKCWMIGISVFLIYCIKVLRKTYTDESDLKVAAVNKMTVKQVKENLQIICKLRRDYQLNFIRGFCDLMIALNENNVPFQVLGKRMNTGVEGIFGVVASFVYLYGLFTSKH